MDSRVNAGKKRADRAEGKGPGATQRGEEGATSGVNMLETVEGQRKKQSVGAVFAREWGRANALLMVGFALCQCWITLCFFAPQLFPDNQSTNVYELSLLVTAVALVPGVAASRRMEALVPRRRFLYLLAACASVGTFVIPFSATQGAVSIVLLCVAALLTGFASGWLFIAWYRAFCLANDYVGFVLSVAVQSVILYVLTSIAMPPDFSPWIMVAIACLMPFASVYLLTAQPLGSMPISEHAFPRAKPQRQALVRLCFSMFAISLVDEFMRNNYLGGTDLVYYSGAVNLIVLVLKVVFSVLIVVALSEHSRHIPLIYKASFLLTMTAVLFMPYMNNDLGYGITNFGAFFFKIMVMLIAFNYCLRFRISPVLVFALTRIVWSLDLFLGFSGFHAYQAMAPMFPDLLGILSVLMGIGIVVTYLFVFTEIDGAPIFMHEQKAEGSDQSDFEASCARLARVGKLSRRETDVLKLIARGRSTPRIQDELHLSSNTVNTHTSHIYQKLGVHSRQELLDLVEQTAPEED